MPYQEIQALGFLHSPRKLGLYETAWACISWYDPRTQLVNSNYQPRGRSIRGNICSDAQGVWTEISLNKGFIVFIPK